MMFYPKPWWFAVYRGWNTTQVYRDYNEPFFAVIILFLRDLQKGDIMIPRWCQPQLWFSSNVTFPTRPGWKAWRKRRWQVKSKIQATWKLSQCQVVFGWGWFYVVGSPFWCKGGVSRIIKYIYTHTLYILPSVLATEKHVMKKKKTWLQSSLTITSFSFLGLFYNRVCQLKIQEPTWNRYALTWLHAMITSMASWSRLRRRKSPVQPRFSSIESSGANLVGTGNGQIGRYAQRQGQTNSFVPVIIEVEMTGVQFGGWPFG